MTKTISFSIIAALASVALLVSALHVFADASVTTDAATAITSTDATLNGTNGSNPAPGHSFWASLASFIPTVDPLVVPPGVFDTGDLGPLGAGASFSTALSSTGITVTPNTTYYFTAYANGSGSWTPGGVLSFTTAPAGPVFIDANTNGVLDPGEQTFTTIQAAVNAAAPTQTIIAGAGTYNESVSITKTLTLKGAQSGVDARTRGVVSESVINGASPIAIFADNVVVDGFTIQGSDSSDKIAGIWFNPGFSGPTHGGFHILNNIIQNNVSGIGVGNDGTIQALIQFNLIKNNNNSGPGSGSGLRTDFGLKNTIIDSNTFINNQAQLNGFGTSGVQTVTFSNNEIENNTSSGLYLLTTSGVTITGNNIHDNANGITVGGGNDAITISGNTLKNNTGDGINVSNDYASYGVVPNTNVTANRNDIEGNSVTGLNVISGTYTGTLDGTCNWWGAADGPGTVGPGSGDTVSAGVTYQPWLTSTDPNLASAPCDGPLPTLTVVKTVTNDNGGTKVVADFPLFIDGSPTTSGATSTVSAGAHVVSETSQAGYAGTFGGDCAANGTITLAPGDVKTCTLENNDIPPSLTLNKVINNDNGGGSLESAWTISAAGPTPISGPGAAGSTDVQSGSTFLPGTYTLSESAGPVGYIASKWSCVKNGGPAVLGSSITLGVGDTAVCTITNDDVPPPPANACNLSQPPAGYTLRKGTTGNDTVTLAPFTMFKGMGGNDKVTAPDGKYIICTGTGNDTISIGNGDFTIDAGGGTNVITTGNGTGYITTGTGNDTITTGTGAHTINAGGGNNTIVTGDGNQTVTTGTGKDNITTGSGNDVINAGSGNNTVKSGAGNDTITAGTGNDNIDAGADADTCNAGSGTNTVVNCSP